MKLSTYVFTSLALVASMVAAVACAGVPGANASVAGDTVYLWPDNTPPLGSGHAPSVPEHVSSTGAVSEISKPRMIIMHPAHPNGTAVLIMGGGGYFKIEIEHEAVPAAKWLESLGVTPAILYYRLRADGWTPVAPFQDAQRALRLLRAQSGSLGIDPHRIGVLGFSAGGNLAGIMATRFDHDFYKPMDSVDRTSARPDFAGLIYAVSSIEAPYDTTHTSKELMRQPDARSAYTIDKHVSHETPPMFLAHAENDPIANIGATLELYDVLRKHHVPAAHVSLR